jgi:hypothetical protein
MREKLATTSDHKPHEILTAVRGGIIDGGGGGGAAFFFFLASTQPSRQASVMTIHAKRRRERFMLPRRGRRGRATQ